MNKRFIITMVSKIVMVEALLFLLPAFVAYIYKESLELRIFLYLSFIVFFVSYILSNIKVKDYKIYARDSLLITALTWIIWSLIGALPIYLTNFTPNYIDALFETVSGFTTTGSTILNDVEILSKSIGFWRIFTHWIGGMGVLVFVLAVIPTSNKGEGLILMRSEVPGPSVGKLVPKARDTAMILYSIYIFLTVLQTIILLFLGMSLYDAILHSFSTAGTGGFSTKNLSISAFNSPSIEYTISIFMILFGINFNVYFFLILRNFKSIFKNEELRAYLIIILVSSLVVCFNIKNEFKSLEEAFRMAFFQVSSIITTTGFITYNFDLWPTLSKLILMLILIIGACGGSTGGGLKVSRIIILLKEIKLYITKLFHPRLINVVSLDEKKVSLDIRNASLIYLLLYFVILVISTILISINNFDIQTTISAVLTTLSNVGPGLSGISPVETFAKFSNFSKIILCINMLIGRLEILPIIFLFSPFVWNTNSKY